MAKFPDHYTFDMQPYVNELVKRVRDVADQQIRNVLEEAFDAGFAYGDAFRAEHDGHTVHPEDFPPNFDQWIADFIARNRED